MFSMYISEMPILLCDLKAAKRHFCTCNRTIILEKLFVIAFVPRCRGKVEKSPLYLILIYCANTEILFII